MFESGAVDGTGAIQGNDNDADPRRYEPHYEQITQPDQVQIYEPILGDAANVPTTGLLTATQYLKDNRLLPRGFDKATATAEIGVYGARRRMRISVERRSRALRSRCAWRRAVRRARWSCCISRSAIAGRTTSRGTTPPSRSGSSTISIDVVGLLRRRGHRDHPIDRPTIG